MYKCLDCGETFRTPATKVYEEPCEYWGAQISEKFTVAKCPCCSSEDIEDTGTCVICGEASEEPVCTECMKDIQWYMEQIRNELGIDNEQLEEAIARYFGW